MTKEDRPHHANATRATLAADTARLSHIQPVSFKSANLIERRKSLEQPLRIGRMNPGRQARTVRSNSDVIIESAIAAPDNRLISAVATSDSQHNITDDVIACYGSPLPGEIVRTRLDISSQSEAAVGCTRLGLQLAGQVGPVPTDSRGVYVAGVLPDSAAANNDVIRVGDQLIQVNNETLLGCSHLNASAIIKSMSCLHFDVVLLRRFVSGVETKSQPQDEAAVSPKSSCLSDITNVSSTAVYNLQRNYKSLPGNCSDAHDALPSNGTSLHNNNCAAADQQPDAKLLVNATERPCNANIYANDNNDNMKICSQTDRVLNSDNNCTVDVITRIDDDDVIGNHVDVIAVSPSACVDNIFRATSEQPPTDSTSDKQPGRCVEESDVCDRKPVARSDEQATPRSERAVADKDHKANAKRKARSGQRSGQHRSSKHSAQSTDDDPTKCPLVAGRETVIEIEKGWQPLGLSVIGGANTLLGCIVINEIFNGGAASRDGRLQVGDQILEVNGEDFRCDVTDEWATEVLHQTPGKVRLTVYRDETPFNLQDDADVFEVFTIDLLKKSGKGLGFSITGRQHDNGIFISDVIKGGVADLDGQLVPGDQILVINGNSVQNATQPDIAALLKTLMGRVSLTVGRVRCLSRSSSSSTLSVDSDDVDIGKAKTIRDLDLIRHKDVKTH